MATDPLKSGVMSDERFAELSAMFAVQRAIDHTGISPTGRMAGTNGSSRLGKVERPMISQTEAYLYAEKLNTIVVQEAFSGAKAPEVPVIAEVTREAAPPSRPAGDSLRLTNTERSSAVAGH